MKRRTWVTTTAILALLAIQGCGSSLHMHYGQSTVSKDSYSTIMNDSLQVRMKASSNIDFIVSEDAAKTFLKKEWQLTKPDNILFIGSSNKEPFYRFIVIMDSKEAFDHGNFSGIKIHSFQRMINGHRFNLVAHGKEANLRPDDFEFMLDNLEIKTVSN